jgi:poly(hydroxyalkanoate) depolymerase family esterase
MARVARWSIPLVAAVVIVLSQLLVAPAAGVTAAVDEQRTYVGPAGSIDYVLHVPASETPMPLLVYLHGCGAPPSVPGLDDLADTRGFAVAYPIQSHTRNVDGCWNWTSAENRHRDQGGPALIAGVTRDVMASEGIDPHRVWIAGHSAGSGMTANLVAAYPDVYSAAAIIAGCGQLSCSDITGLSARAEMGSRARAVPVYMLWGTQDATNPYLTGRLQLLQWLGMNDLGDDGFPNLSVPRLPTSTRRFDADGTTPAYVVERYAGPAGGEVRFVSAIGMGHVPDARWQPAFPAMVDFLLASPPLT